MIRLQRSLMKGTAIHLGEIVSNSDPKAKKLDTYVSKVELEER